MAIYYRCPDKDYPVGGIRVIYRHVDILNRNGFEAFVLHHFHPFRCTWFENETPVAHEVRYPDRSRSLPARAGRTTLRALGRPPQIDPLPVLELGADDILVLPEVMPAVPELEAEIRKVVFNQNAYLTLAPYPVNADPKEIVYARPEVLGAIVCRRTAAATSRRSSLSFRSAASTTESTRSFSRSSARRSGSSPTCRARTRSTCTRSYCGSGSRAASKAGRPSRSPAAPRRRRRRRCASRRSS